MAGEPIVTLIGNTTADPEIRYVTQANRPVVNFTIAHAPRVKSGDDWQDGETMFVRASLWGDEALNFAESVPKGTRVVAQGRLYLKSWTAKDGSQGQNLEMNVDELSVSIKRATVKVTKNPPKNGGGNFGGNTTAPPAPTDPWAGAPSSSAPSWDTPQQSEVPF